MRKYQEIPELPETYKKESAADERWVTVQELRDRFSMTRNKSSTVSGYLRQLKFGSFSQCSYIVHRIEPTNVTFRSSPPKYRHLVKRKNKVATAFCEDNP